MDTDPVCVFPDNPDGIDTFRSILKDARCVIAHNAKFDMSWLRETGFDTDAKLIDTMINQYVLNRGQRGPLSLSALAEIYGVTRKLDSLGQALDAGQNYSDLDKETQIAYLSADVLATAEIYA
jgi:DNA polymerase I-like protein with 3'-5' exonuclease and polymerase domains